MNDRHLGRIVKRGIFALAWRSGVQRRSEAKRDTGNPKTGPASGAFAFLNSAGVSNKRIEFRKRQTLFSQGEPAKHVFYIQEGSVKLAVTSAGGKDAVVALLGAGDFLGEACLAGQPL
jgi:CRP-like cAMP-binding protein